MSNSMASMQFATHRQVQIGADEEYNMGEHQTGKSTPKYQGPPDVAPLSAKTLSSADRVTAWRLRRGANEAPQPYSARTAGSLYTFDEK